MDFKVIFFKFWYEIDSFILKHINCIFQYCYLTIIFFQYLRFKYVFFLVLSHIITIFSNFLNFNLFSFMIYMILDGI